MEIEGREISPLFYLKFLEENNGNKIFAVF